MTMFPYPQRTYLPVFLDDIKTFAFLFVLRTYNMVRDDGGFYVMHVNREKGNLCRFTVAFLRSRGNTSFLLASKPNMRIPHCLGRFDLDSGLIDFCL